MVEQDKSGNARSFDSRRFNETWGGKEPDAILEAIKLTRMAAEEDLPIGDLADKLAQRFLIVPGDNSIANEQLTALWTGYMANREAWDAILDGRE